MPDTIKALDRARKAARKWWAKKDTQDEINRHVHRRDGAILWFTKGYRAGYLLGLRHGRKGKR